MSNDALSSFETKWTLAHPELPLALRFVSPPMRTFVSAFACLTFEVSHAAFHIVEPEVARTKLHWWAEEFSALASGKPRHPLTEALANWKPMAELSADMWSAVVVGAMAQRESVPASSLAGLLDSFRRLHEPLAAIESALYPRLDLNASAQAAALSRAVHETGWMAEALARDRLPLPLDLLARHQLSRADLGQPGDRRDAAMREHLAALAASMRSIDRRGLSPLTAAELQAAQKRGARAARAADPLAECAGKLDRLPLSSVWASWRAARRMQASA
ncbi:MAG: squalene/phytoene synthase family protein [Xanthomonadales bacterium]|nr:squalene/phytoene synthase family protein [Xanthomonadales bacterium]